MKTETISHFQFLDTLMNALTVGGVAITFAVVIVVSNVPGLAA